ncbi:MAG: bifunctional diguanylate cyclase/phosphodiesterase [Epsilonproteobacteria bacterium]|nr:bifunctional diguanylate cyclase/phosphodiesterase [Campylobacterota bacterium]
MKKRVALKLMFVAAIGLMIVGFVYYFHRVSEDYFINSNQVLYKLNSLNRNEDRINYEVLYTSVYLNDNTKEIKDSLQRQKRIIEFLSQNGFFKKYYKVSFSQFLKYRSDFAKKEELIFEFLNYIRPIKDSLLFISTSLPNLQMRQPHTRYYILQIVTKLMLLERSNDLSLIKQISLAKVKSLLDINNQNNRAFIKSLELLLDYYPKQTKILNQILNYKTQKTLKEIFKSYLNDTNKNVMFFQNILILIVVVISVLFVSVMVLIYKLEMNIEQITTLAKKDMLTGLNNRLEYEEDIKKMKAPALILFDIDKFKNLNNYFGSALGDKILKAFAKELRKFLKIVRYDLKAYRFGSDEFGLLGDGIDTKELQKIANEFIRQIELRPILEEKLDLSINVSAGITKDAPYLENAEIALKEAKKDMKKKFVVYENSLNEKVKRNIQMANEIKHAIENGGIIPYFQAIFDREGNIFKYEVLCRVRVGDEIKSIYPYLDVVKENKMYYQITMKILEQSLKVMKQRDISLSVNLSLEDVIDDEIRAFIYENFVGEIAKRTTFEILESEIGKYEILEEFMDNLHKRGISFAIDDFGSGYSNFSRALKLKVDYIKIDGSIIKNIDKEESSRSILKTILLFCKENGLKSVAEFVHNKEVYQKAKEMGVDYFQGFYLAQPKPLEEI